MTITSKDLTDLYSTPWASRGIRGRVEVLKRKAGRNAQGYPALTARERQHLDYLPQPAPQRREYDNPTAVPRRDARLVRDNPLTPADIAWIQQLPDDPARVSYDDARALARLDADWPQEHAGNGRLVRAKLAPIRRYHDRKQAEARLETLRATAAPNIDDNVAIEMLTDAVRREVPQLTDDEAHERACTMLREAKQQAAAKRTQEIDEADAQVRAAARPANPDDMSESPAYQRMMRVAAMSGDGPATRAVAAYDSAPAEPAAEAAPAA